MLLQNSFTTLYLMPIVVLCYLNETGKIKNIYKNDVRSRNGSVAPMTSTSAKSDKTRQ